ncbi:short-chain dehydrogenase, partial [bacterium]
MSTGPESALVIGGAGAVGDGIVQALAGAGSRVAVVDPAGAPEAAAVLAPAAAPLVIEAPAQPGLAGRLG